MCTVNMPKLSIQRKVSHIGSYYSELTQTLPFVNSCKYAVLFMQYLLACCRWCSPPPFLNLNGIVHSQPTAASLPPQPCAPRPVSGGISCASPSRPHTHTHSNADKAAGAANEAKLFVRRARPLLSVPVREEGMTPLLSPPFVRTTGFWRVKSLS